MSDGFNVNKQFMGTSKNCFFRNIDEYKSLKFMSTSF